MGSDRFPRLCVAGDTNGGPPPTPREKRESLPPPRLCVAGDTNGGPRSITRRAAVPGHRVVLDPHPGAEHESVVARAVSERSARQDRNTQRVRAIVENVVRGLPVGAEI